MRSWVCKVITKIFNKDYYEEPNVVSVAVQKVVSSDLVSNAVKLTGEELSHFLEEMVEKTKVPNPDYEPGGVYMLRPPSKMISHAYSVRSHYYSTKSAVYIVDFMEMSKLLEKVKLSDITVFYGYSQYGNRKLDSMETSNLDNLSGVLVERGDINILYVPPETGTCELMPVLAEHRKKRLLANDMALGKSLPKISSNLMAIMPFIEGTESYHKIINDTEMIDEIYNEFFNSSNDIIKRLYKSGKLEEEFTLSHIK